MYLLDDYTSASSVLLASVEELRESTEKVRAPPPGTPEPALITRGYASDDYPHQADRTSRDGAREGRQECGGEVGRREPARRVQEADCELDWRWIAGRGNGN